jgi:hypothetical protein
MAIVGSLTCCYDTTEYILRAGFRHITDYREHRGYLERDPLAVAGVELGGIRTLLVVPMLKDEKTFGTIASRGANNLQARLVRKS